ncbi:DUF4191 domain-containing protein [Bailinhaonella thermotolerans]|uniref:DUF4191 domain-containing protein n=1 Tax=Bailinhaonella thermotolerans TaxID=1070861 RepID=A0A3A3ZYM0_9ACTN|nr:DUF4191 domain-containing protein [Bailinhaonella thermotolerans]RJL20525.1 DUF4191 domain-containing protein [Bailinhaonella thermotolerans]
MAKKAASPETPGRLKQIRMVAGIVRQANPKGMPIVFATALGVLALFVVIGLVTDSLLFMIPLGLLGGLTAGMIVFGQFAQKAQYSMLEGQPGAAAAILQSMRGNWNVTPVVAVNREQDVVHRVVGAPGVILVSEGPANRVQRLLLAEKKKVQRVAMDVPVYDVQTGDGEGQVPIKKLQRHLMKLPRNLKKPAVAEVNYRLRALQSSLPMPKGPMPKGVKMPKGPRPKTR